ncbi:MAG: hypothetical protein KAR62_02335, partial [Sphingomonadales bacterium]|nr:hypothetical protein [Sphingomonadales bacterium]
RDDNRGQGEFRKSERKEAYKNHHKRADRQVSDAEALKKLLDEKPQQTRASIKKRGGNRDETRPVKVKLKGKGKLKNKGKSKKLKNRKSNAKSTGDGGFGTVQRRGN